MPVGFPSLRVDKDNASHHLWCNNGTWWVHYTIHFDHRKRRIRKSLQTHSLAEAIARRDALLTRIEHEGAFVPAVRSPQPFYKRTPKDNVSQNVAQQDAHAGRLVPSASR